MLQALYFCQPFRDKVLAYKEHQTEGPGRERDKDGETETLLSVLGDLFVQIATCKKKFGVIDRKSVV